MAWLTRGLVEGVVTSRWPDGPDRYHTDSVSNIAEIRAQARGLHREQVVELCPTGAVVDEPSGTRVVAERCIGCGACVHADPEVFGFRRGSGQARLVQGEDPGDPARIARARASLASRTRRLGRSVHLRHVDAGSDGSEEWEIAALTNPDYDIHRLGLFFTPSPRHADVLLVTGIGATGMLASLQRTWEGMPHPKLVVAVGTDACSGGLLANSYASSGGLRRIGLDVDVWVPGSPPTPFAILHGLLLALDRLPDGEAS